MNDVIDLEAMFMTPAVAAKLLRREEEMARHFAELAARPYYLHAHTAAQARDEHRERAARLRELAKPTNRLTA